MNEQQLQARIAELEQALFWVCQSAIPVKRDWKISTHAFVLARAAFGSSQNPEYAEEAKEAQQPLR